MLKSLDRQFYHRSIFSISLFAFAFMMSYPLIGTNIITAILVLNWVLEGRLKQKMQLLAHQKLALLTMTIFFIYILSLFFSDNVYAGLKIIEVKISILLLTLVLATSKPSQNQLHTALLFFCTGILAKSIAAWVLFYNNYLTYNSLGSIMAQGSFRDNYTLYTTIHPTYFSIYLLFGVFSIIYLVYNYHKSISKFLILAAGITVLYFLALSVLLSSRMPLAAFTLITLGLAIYSLVASKRYILLFLGIGAIVAAITLMLQSPLLNLRFKEIKETAFVAPQGIHHNSTNIRIALYNCSFAGVKENWLIGLGAGSVQDFLNRCYQSNSYSDLLYEENYGVHNAFLDIWLTAGLLGIVVILMFYITAIYISYTQRKTLYLVFILFFALCSLTEATLNTNKGIVFFSFFNAMLAFSSEKELNKQHKHSNLT